MVSDSSRKPFEDDNLCSWVNGQFMIALMYKATVAGLKLSF